MEEKKSRKAVNYIVGIIVIALVIIGLISTVNFFAGRVKDATDNTAQLREYESFIAPVIMNDPDTFDDVSKADLSQLTAISIWSILNDNVDPDKYDYTDEGMLMPQKEVETRFTKLFGSDVKLTHSTADGGGIEFKYSEKKQCYIIPITGITPIYTPKVLEAKEKSNSVILTVGYLASEDWTQDEHGNMVSPEPAKYVRVTLRKGSDSNYYVSAIQAETTK
ncbi:MAG: hypothetical protein NC122_02525 [Faecalibacterium sp.]|nr:hypothetical protein [Ruminococcus sp.]MCM1392514.1 hypothetical protein [Ruminococcus sp.]MCM1485059.1 hypothetical protein [Faecalibacterium sp.]